MCETVEIPKSDGDNFPSWTGVVNSSGERLRPHIRCKCGDNTNISNHHIHADGTITASYYHHWSYHPDGLTGCGWHVYLKMIGWDGGELLPGQDKINL